MQTWVVGESSVIAQSDVFLFPLLVQRFRALFVEVALLDGNGTTAAKLTQHPFAQ